MVLRKLHPDNLYSGPSRLYTTHMNVVIGRHLFSDYAKNRRFLTLSPYITNTLHAGFPIHQFADFVRFLKNPVFWVRSFLSSVRSFFWPQLHHFWAQLDRFPVYLGLRWFESSISWKFYVGFHVKTNFQKLWKPQFSQLDKICAQLG